MKGPNLLLVLALTTFAASISSSAVDKSSYLKNRQSQVSGQNLRSAVLGNDYIEMEVNANGEFTIGTVQGDPSRAGDDNAKLIYGHPSPGTSDTVVRINGTNSSIHSGGTLTDDGSSEITYQVTISGIEITQKLTIVKNPGSLVHDTVRIYYSLRNTTGISANVGIRVQMDTMLGDNDGAPFRIPNLGEVTHDTEFDNRVVTSSITAIPTYALVFDSLTNPGILAQMTFLDSAYTSPDRVVFGYWPDSVNDWFYTVDPTQNFLDHNNDGTITGSSPDSDSSVVVWWGEPDSEAIVLAAGETREMAIYYGMANCTLQNGNPFSILVCSPSEMTGSLSGSTFRYDPDPLTISAFFVNSAGAAISGARGALSLTPGLAINTGQTAERALETSPGGGVVAAGESVQVDWDLTTTARYLGLRPFAVRVLGGATAVRNVFLHAIPNAVYGQATDTSGDPVSGATVNIYRGSTLRGTVTTQTDGTYALGGLEAGEYRVVLQWSGGQSSSVAVVTDSESGGATGNPTAFNAASEGSHYSYPNPVRDGIARISIYTDSAKSADITIFDSAGHEVDALALQAPSAGWHSVDWRTGDRANGLYYYVIEIGGKIERGTIAVLKRRL